MDDSRGGTFYSELEALVNRHSMESVSNTPDFVLASFLKGVLREFNTAVCARDFHSGEREVQEGLVERCVEEMRKGYEGEKDTDVVVGKRRRRECPFYAKDRLCAKQDFRQSKAWESCGEGPCTIERPEVGG